MMFTGDVFLLLQCFH